MSGRLQGKIAVVTGAGQGLGEAIAVRFAQEGAAGVLVNDLNAETAGRTAEQVKAAGSRALAVAGSVMDEAFVVELMERAIKELGSVDVLVNNAGITRDKLMKDMSAADFDAVVNLNLRATFLCCKYGTPPMVAKKWGRVINMSSRAHLGNKGQTNYSASKAGVIGLTRSLAFELGKFGVTANCIAPGVIATPGVTSLPHYQSLVERVAPTLPIPRLGKPEDVAGVAAFLASEDSSYITAETIHVSGGRY
jgi:3-oxoacyl-[acyl-carrier protein] reductase